MRESLSSFPSSLYAVLSCTAMSSISGTGKTDCELEGIYLSFRVHRSRTHRLRSSTACHRIVNGSKRPGTKVGGWSAEEISKNKQILITSWMIVSGFSDNERKGAMSPAPWFAVRSNPFPFLLRRGSSSGPSSTIQVSKQIEFITVSGSQISCM